MIMDIKTYIDSGILERFAKGEVTSEERTKVEVLLAIHSKLGEELELIYMRLESEGT